MSRASDLERIEEGIRAAAEAIRPFTPGAVAYEIKSERGDPLTAADQAADDVLKQILPRAGEGWLSEESADDHMRLGCRRVWIVDPIDGTREFVAGIPEWCISVGLIEDGQPVAGGIYNPATDEFVLGSLETGVTLNGEAASITDRVSLDGATIVASRSEVNRGEWERFEDAPFVVRPCGSVAYKLALVAAGQVDGTWTLVPKSEWDVAAGAALMRAAGGTIVHADGAAPLFNQAKPKYPNFLASSASLVDEFRRDWL